MKKIKSLKILGKQYKIDYRGPGSKSLKYDDQRCLGVCYSDDALMIIANNLTDDVLAEVLIHESLHAFSDSLKIGLREDQVHRLAECLLSFLKDNQEVVEQIYK